jgi:hypothetical protein
MLKNEWRLDLAVTCYVKLLRSLNELDWSDKTYFNNRINIKNFSNQIDFTIKIEWTVNIPNWSDKLTLITEWTVIKLDWSDKFGLITEITKNWKKRKTWALT